MKRKLRTFLGIVAAIFALTTVSGLTSCGNNEGWYPEHPGYWNHFFDPSITGYWQLAQVNGQNVDGTDVNYLYFNGNGGGNYYSFVDGSETLTPLKYSCTGSDSAVSQTQLDVTYGNGQPRAMVYWLNENALWLQWISGGKVTTYVYRQVGSAPW